MATIRYIGQRDVFAEGKALFEILSQLKNFGIGRMVTKSEWARKFPSQPSYCIIRKVEARMDRWLWHGTMWADFVYRGKPVGVLEFDRSVDRSDWRLIHKRDEATFSKCDDKPFVSRRIPSKVPLPPLRRYVHQQKQLHEGKDPNDIPMLPLVPYADDDHKFLIRFTELLDEMSPKPDGSIYDVDPNPYLDVYGDRLPIKVEGWSSAEKFLTAAEENNIFLDKD